MAKGKLKTEAMLNDKEKALQLAQDAVIKQFGKGSLIYGDIGDFPEIERISTGSLGLDLATGGGYAKGRIIEVFGPESSGKTTLTLHAIAECQKTGGLCAFIDAEHAFDAKYATNLGVQVDKLLFSQPDCGEDALNITETLCRSQAISLVVIDSVAALTPRVELEGEVGDSHMGRQARMMSQGCRKLAGVAEKTNTTIMFVNQIRMKIGVMFGNPETTTGGNALKFYASQRLEVRRAGTVKIGDEIRAITSRLKVAKNKTAPPFKQCEVDIVFGKGIDQTKEILDIGVERSIIDKSGAWYSYKNERIGQGRENASAFLKERPDIAKEIKEKILQLGP